MATQNRTSVDLTGDGSILSTTWVLTATDQGAPLVSAAYADQCMQVGTTGDTFGTGTIIIEGSNDGNVWTTLNNPQGVSLSFTAPGLKQVLENPAYIRPRASVAVTSVTIILTSRRATPLRT